MLAIENRGLKLYQPYNVEGISARFIGRFVSPNVDSRKEKIMCYTFAKRDSSLTLLEITIPEADMIVEGNNISSGGKGVIRKMGKHNNEYAGLLQVLDEAEKVA